MFGNASSKSRWYGGWEVSMCGLFTSPVIPVPVSAGVKYRITFLAL